MTTLRIVLAQLNLTVGDIEGNLAKMIGAAKTARDSLKADIIVFPELSITGYPPEDLLFRKAFIDAAHDALIEFVEQVKNIYCVVGHPRLTPEGLCNACSLIYNGEILGEYAKQHLPNYGVFDEYRYFVPGHLPCVVPIKDISVGIMICEDLWHETPVRQAAEQGAKIILSPNASPFEIHKHDLRCATFSKRAADVHLPIVYVNCIGGQDELVFDGGSMLMDQDGNICQHAGFFNEELLPTEIEFTDNTVNIKQVKVDLPTEEQRIYQALVLGVRDYMKKNGFQGALIGASGGIDSSLTLAIAVDALGKENVGAVLLPSRFTSEMSNEDAITLAKNLGINYDIISIEPPYKSFIESLSPLFSGTKPDLTEENLQSRCRGMILMALSNKFGHLILTTGNRSELAVGYATLYGDMAGGFAVLKDVPKTLVYRLARYRNQLNPVIPERVFERPPTAELADNQKDEDSLPPYSILDQIIELYIDKEYPIKKIVEKGFELEIVNKVVRLINKNEYKRRQSPVGVRINHKAFGRDRRYPMTSRFNE
jgi:NAD+ synthase (glutamine-hydrolysing)